MEYSLFDIDIDIDEARNRLAWQSDGDNSEGRNRTDGKILATANDPRIVE